MKKSTKHFLFLTTAAIAGMYAYNKFVACTSTKKNLLSESDGSHFEWKFGNMFYTKRGKGKPILLIHDMDPSSSSIEWSKIAKKLEKDHTVYSIDLLGCGRSEKPALNYTNYMYVQLITAFVKEIIKEKTDVVATNLSSSFVLMSNHMDSEIFDKIILINPVSLKELQVVPDEMSKVKRVIMNLPILGTFIYNVLHNPIHIDLNFREKYFSKAQLVSNQMKDSYYEAAHLDESNGKYLHSSLIGNYMNIDIAHAVKRIDKPIYVIGSRGIKKNTSTLNEYRKLNSNFEITYLSNANLYPQLEIPDKVVSVITNYLKK